MTTPDHKRLIVLFGGHRAGVVTEGAGGRLDLTYDDAWRADRRSTPLSLSLPFAQPSHPDPVVRAFLWGLLPDNEQVLDRWARRYQVSVRNPFGLLRHVGEDCAGAAQFATPDRVEALLAREGTVDWIDDAAIGIRLRTLRRDPSAWHATAAGQFSLAGARAKTALYYDPDGHRWGVPTGAVPTTHILKPAVTGLDDHDLNEHLCLETARMLGLSAPRSDVTTFDGERAIVVERYDRARADDGSIRRVHQEDVCQALGLPPTAKYQNDGGPSPEQIIELPVCSIGSEHIPTGAVTPSADSPVVTMTSCRWRSRGRGTRSSTRSIRAASPTPTGMGSGTCPASSPGWITWPGSEWTRSG